MRLLKYISICIFSSQFIFASYGDGSDHNGSGLTLNDTIYIPSGTGYTFIGDVGEDGSIDGGHGVNISGQVIIDDPTNQIFFQGGAGAVAVNETRAPNGGSGIFINANEFNANVILSNITAAAGSGGVNFTFDGYNFGQQGNGIEWSIGSSNTAFLSIFGSTISNGLSISASQESYSDFSYTNTSIFGGIEKTGSGILKINNRDENSLNDLDIKDGAVVFSDYLTIGSEEQISLSSQNSMLIASNGLNLVGIVSGSGSMQVYNDMVLSGALSGSLSINLSSISNSVTLQNGYNLSDAIFNGNSLDDSLIIENSGVHNAQFLGIGTTFQNFENIQLSSFDDVWEAETNFNYFVDGGDGNDMFAFNLSTNYSINDFIQITNNIIGFESYGLSTGDDIWKAETNDNVIGSSINGREGVDKISFENYRPESSEIGSLYQGFEGAILEKGTNIWVNTSDYSQLDFIDGSSGVWTLAYTNDYGINASAISNGTTTGYYRNFEGISLTSFNDSWNITNNDNDLSLIDGKEGTNTLRIVTQGEGSSSQIGTKYINFDILELNDSENFWSTTSNDLTLDYIINNGGIGYVFFDNNSVSTNSSLFGDDKLFRNFDVIGLNGGDDTWFSTTNDINIIRVSGNDGQDTVSFSNYELEITNFSKEMIEDNYVDFENIILTSNSNNWTYSANDNVFGTIDASDGKDALLVRGDINWTSDIKNRYEDFESLEIENGVLSFDSFSLGDDIENLILENNSIVDLQDGSLNNFVNYIQENGSILKMNVKTNLSSLARIEAVHIEFNPSSSVQFFGDTGSFAVGDRYTNYLGQASSSIDVNDDSLFDNNPGSIDVKSWFLENDGLYVIFDRRSLTNQLFGFSVPRGSQTEKILTEIDSLQTADASRMADLIFSDTFSLNDLNKVYSRTVALPRAMSHQRNGVLRAITERANERRISLSNFNKPIGVNGPIANQAGISIWSKGYSANGTASADSNIEGYDLSGVGTIFGLDYAAKKYVAGIAAGTTSQTMKMDSSGEYTGSGTHFTGYMSYGIDGWFIESSASIANSSLDFVSAGAFDLKTNYSANDFTFYLGAGYLMKGDTSSWIPEIGFVLNNYNQDNTQDVSQEIVATNLDDLAETSLQMRLGLTGGFKQDLVGRELLTQVKLRWLNAVGVSEEEIDFQLSGGSNVYQTPILNAAKSIVEFGVGTQLRMNRSFSLLMGFDYEVGGGYSANRLSAGVRYSF